MRPLKPHIHSLTIYSLKANKINIAVEALKVQRSDCQDRQLNSMRLTSTEICTQEREPSTCTSSLETVTDLQQPTSKACELQPTASKTQRPRLIPTHEQRARISKSTMLDSETGMDAIMGICTDPSARNFELLVSSLSGSCSKFCSCACHKATRLRTSNASRALIGGLFLGYAGKPSGKPHCDERDCRSSASFTLRITYYFVRLPHPKLVALC